MITTELIAKLQHKNLSVDKIYGDIVLFNINGKLSFTINVKASELSIYTMDMYLRVFILINLSDLRIVNGTLFFDRQGSSYIIL